MKEILTIYSYVDGTNDVPFYDSDNPIVLTEYTYSTQRMGASSLSATLMHAECLDDHWDGKQYVTFKGQRFFLKNTPSSGKDNEDERYRHTLEFAPERDIVLSNTYFYDAVSDYSTADDKYKSNSSKVIFTGDIHEFVNRIHQSMQYSGLNFSAYVDASLTSEIKQVAFEDLSIFEALQQAYEVYGIPFYFVRNEVWFGYTDNVITESFEYGVENELISIQKNNANQKIVTRCTGTGSEDNIPYYYPNNSPKGNIFAKAGATSPNLTDADIVLVDREKYAEKVGQTDSLVCVAPQISNMHAEIVSGVSSPYLGDFMSGSSIAVKQRSLPTPVFRVEFDAEGEGSVPFAISWDFRDMQEGVSGYADFKRMYHVWKDGDVVWNEYQEEEDELVDEWEDDRQFTIFVPIEGTGHYSFQFSVDVWMEGHPDNRGEGNLYFYFDVSQNGWELNGEPVNLKDLGIKLLKEPTSGDSIVQEKSGWITPSHNLMPPIYRQRYGAERFYNAINDTYIIPGSSPVQEYEFENEYIRTNPREHIVDFPDIKPTIEGVKNASGELMAQFLDVAFDDDDSDEKDENNNFLHPYFYVKLPKFDGEFGFNLFDHAIDEGEMTFAMKTGPCAGCSFVLGVSNDEFQQNIVQVNPDGTLKKKDGKVVLGAPQEQQNDTVNNEVWVALKKEESTFGVLMPNRTQNYFPEAGNKFVVLHINLPQAYIEAAEERLKEAIIKFMAENNSDKFNFTVNFSRVYFAENDSVYQQVDENARINIIYNGHPVTLYITSFTYRAEDGESLPEITVEVAENITVNRNALQNAINEIKDDIAAGAMAADVPAVAASHFVSKKHDDVVAGYLKMLKGLLLGDNSSITVDEAGNATAIVDFLKVNKKAVFSQIEVQEKHHVGGQLVVSLASINCTNVTDTGTAYRCYFETDAGKGDGVENLFAIDDLAICQTYNSWGNKYYWRRVVGIGENYIDLSIEDCDENSGIPDAGDKIVQLGNKTNEERQNAIIIAASGENAPCIIQYKGINDYLITDENIVTKLSPNENLITGVLRIQQGTTGAENIADLPDFIKANVGDIETGESGSNLLRNSGFTGDYLSKGLTDQEVLDEVTKMENPPLVHWEATNVEVEENADSESSFGVKFSEGGVLSQELYYSLIPNESYVLSFKAKSDSGATLTYTVGDQVGDIVLGAAAVRHKAKFIVTAKNKVFSLACNDCSLWEVQLERGTMASSWGASMLDNSSDRAYWQAQKYVTGAIEDASTTFAGGLGLTNMMMLGNYDKETKSMTEVTAGMSGNMVNDNDVAFWAGGDYEASVHTAIEYLVNHAKGEWQPTEEELANMAKFVLTHGGTAILNDIILRGIVYATGGKFEGAIDIDAKDVTGRVVIDDNGLIYYGKKTDGQEYARISLGGTCHGASMVATTPDADAEFCAPAAVLAIGDENHRAIQAHGDSWFVGNLRVVEGEAMVDNIKVREIIAGNVGDEEETYITIPNGQIRGIRPSIRKVSGTTISTTSYDHTIIIPNNKSAKITIDITSDAHAGQEYKILSASAVAIDIIFPTRVVLANTGEFLNAGGTLPLSASRREITMAYDGTTWWVSYVNHS